MMPARGDAIAEDSARLKTSLVEMSEKLAEDGLAGQVTRAIVVTMNVDGELNIEYTGCRASDAIGMLGVMQNVLMRNMLR